MNSGLTTIGAICDIKTGKKDVNAENKNGKYPFFTCAKEIHKINDYSFDGEAVLVAGNGFFNVKYYDGKFDAYQRTYVLHNFNDFVRGKFLYHFISHKLDEITKNNRGSTIRYIRISDLSEQKIYIPSIEEQDKAIKFLDQAIEKINQSESAIFNSGNKMNKFRQAILSAAVSGKLTENWREKHGEYDWEDTTLQAIIKDKPRNGYSPKPADFPTKVKSLTLSATTKGVFDPSHFKYIDEEFSDDSHLWLEYGDILIQRANSYELVGVSAMFDGKGKEFIYPDLMMKVKPNEKAIGKFILYLLSSQKTRNYFRQNATGTSGNMPKINQVIVMNTPVLLPSVEEQKEIVKRVDSYFELANTIEKQIETAELKASKLSQAILAKTFRNSN